ncbi:MAG: hypothetical protein RBS39_10325 [Phycisphaerales bacterium]|jgi:hypothetical protein|nr:hypothetical protein [Phycisphaerales bacterium]
MRARSVAGVGALTLTALLGACAPKTTLHGRAIEGTASIAVLVSDEDQRLELDGIGPTRIELRYKGAMIAKAESAADGLFKLVYNPDSVPSDPVEIVARRDGYAPARTTVFPPKPGQAALVQLKRLGPVPAPAETSPGRKP